MATETKTKPSNKAKNHGSKSNGTLNTLENGALDFHVSPANNHSSLLSAGPQCKKVCYKSNGDIDKSTVNSCRTSCVSVNHSEEKENGLEKDMNLTEEVIRKKAYKWCKDSLGGAWSHIASQEDLIINPICKGMSNYLYLISLPSSHATLNSEPKEVLLRIYGEISKSTLDFLIHNSVVFALLAEKKLGPKPYAMYHDGRIEEFIKAEDLTPFDLSRPDIMTIVSQKLALFHNLNMPLSKKPSWFRSVVRGWMDDIHKNKSALAPTYDAIQKLSPSTDLLVEFDMLAKLASNLHSPVVFCHNDLQAGNLLYQAATNETPVNITIIDWEYANYNYRGHDLANHFNEWTLDYSTGLPGYKWFPEKFPTKEQQHAFFKMYLEASGVSPVTQEALDGLYRETSYLVLHSHFLWAYWAMYLSITSEIEFDYRAYAVTRFDGYFRHKQKLVEEFGGFGELV